MHLYPPAGEEATGDVDPHVKNAEDILREVLKTKVRIKFSRSGRGRIEIDYFSVDELTRLCELIGHRE